LAAIAVRALMGSKRVVIYVIATIVVAACATGLCGFLLFSSANPVVQNTTSTSTSASDPKAASTVSGQVYYRNRFLNVAKLVATAGVATLAAKRFVARVTPAASNRRPAAAKKSVRVALGLAGAATVGAMLLARRADDRPRPGSSYYHRFESATPPTPWTPAGTPSGGYPPRPDAWRPEMPRSSSTPARRPDRSPPSGARDRGTRTADPVPCDISITEPIESNEAARERLLPYQDTLKACGEIKKCIICYEDQPCVDMKCKHALCFMCAGDHVRDCLHASAKRIPATCPIPDCVQVITPDQIEPYHLLNDSDMKRLEHWCARNNAIAAFESGVIPCVKCKAIFAKADVDDNTHEGTCPHCRAEFCPNCHFKPHPGRPCAETVKECVLDEETRICPRCREGIFRTEGCDHMTCKCKYEFCFQCGIYWNERGSAHNFRGCKGPWGDHPVPPHALRGLLAS
ncbi:hypothetical protein PBRA_000314, partial [Plasmodiophora brassicae]